jgi:hypothetical protein
MSKHLRVSEKWFNRGLWLLAFVFASFLIGLGGTLVADLPKIEKNLKQDDFLDVNIKAKLTQQREDLVKQRTEINQRLATENNNLSVATSNLNLADASFNTWLETRKATEAPSQNQELIKKTKELEVLRSAKLDAENKSQKLKAELIKSDEKEAIINEQMFKLLDDGSREMAKAQSHLDLRVFLYRLALTLPLLVLAAYLFVRYRKTSYWPFVWGFIIFALFAFFVELVPYLPSYGGYVRHIVGILLTFVIGKYLIKALQKYLLRQRELEQQPDLQRKKNIEYDLALSRIQKNICPGCERPINKETDNFCQHCGIELFENCSGCATRKISFSKFCFNCGIFSKKGSGSSDHEHAVDMQLNHQK